MGSRVEVMAMGKWISRPDDIDALVRQWAEQFPEYVRAESKPQYGGRPVWALTVTDRNQAVESKPAAMFFKPHAHEPAPVSAQMNFVSQLLTGCDLEGTATRLPREEILARTELCFMPDANPAGTATAPVDAWDGTQYTNEELWAWMQGIDPENGKMWKRVDLWDDTVEHPLPLRYGIVYEQITEHEYVEPNRHHGSTLFKWIFELRGRRKWDRMLSLHQTEFVGMVHNCMAILPCLYEKQPPEVQYCELAWAQRIVEAWAAMPGGKPLPEIKPLGYTGRQRQYFVERWGDIYKDGTVVISEICTNSLLCPPELQQALNEKAIEVTVLGLLD